MPLLFGIFLGIQHAFEADHIIAVSAIVTQQKNIFKSALIGAFWGIGHTSTLLGIGLLVLILKISIPHNVNLILEFGVGIMLIILGSRNLFNKIALHSHIYSHDNINHEHPHIHANDTITHKHHTALFIGGLHGLAGSGALMLLVLSSIQSTYEGIFFILLFGIGSMLGMTLMSIVIGIPFIYSSNKLPFIKKYLIKIVGVISIVVGFFILYEIAVVEKLFIH